MINAAWRRPGPAEPIAAVIRDTGIGRMLVASTAKGVCALRYGDDDAELMDWLATVCPNGRSAVPDAAADAAAEVAVAWTETPRSAPPAPPLDLRGAAFRLRVWAEMRTIPRGETWTYSELAAASGAPQAVRAAASACANNLISLFVPCHRVVRRGGNLANYAWGVDRKAALLRREGAVLQAGTPAQMSMAV